MPATTPRPLALFAVAALALASCAAPIVPRQIPFHEADFAGAKGSGTASITGRVFVTMKDNSVRIGSNETPILLPVNAYTDEVIRKKYVEGRNLAEGDPRYYQYLRSAQADSDGYFTFHGLPAGDYYIADQFQWSHWIWNTNNDGTLYKITIAYRTPIYIRVSVQNGQAVRVGDWIQCKARQL